MVLGHHLRGRGRGMVVFGRHCGRNQLLKRRCDPTCLRNSRRGKFALILWMLLLGWGVASLLFYRSGANHGPDMVGDEVSRFLMPMLTSLGIAFGLRILPGPLPKPFGSRKYAPLLISALVGASAVAVYCAFVVR